jgi:hypothetical protein
MTTIESAVMTIRAPGGEYEVDEAQLAAVSFLARHNGRTIEAYRHDLRGFFPWATDHGTFGIRASGRQCARFTPSVSLVRGHVSLGALWRARRPVRTC